MYGVVEFYKTAKANDINPVIGCEVYAVSYTHLDVYKRQGYDHVK